MTREEEELSGVGVEGGVSGEDFLLAVLFRPLPLTRPRPDTDDVVDELELLP